MKLGKLDIPCGCESRKEIIVEGGAGRPEFIIIGAAFLLAVIAWKVGKL